MRVVKEVFFLVGVCFALARGMSDEVRDLINSLHAQCASDSGASEDSISRAQKGEFDEDDKLKCYMKCLFDEVGLFDDDGHLDIDGAVAMLPDEIKGPFGPTVRKCASQSTGSPCDFSFAMYKCCFSESPQYYFLP